MATSLFSRLDRALDVAEQKLKDSRTLWGEFSALKLQTEEDAEEGDEDM